MAKTIRQSVQAIAKPKPQLDVATIIDVDVLAKDSNGVVLSVAPAVTANVHGTGGLQRIELSAGIDPLKLNIGDEIFVTQVKGRYIGVAPLPITNRTQGGGESYGNDGNDGMAQAQNLNAQIAGSALELAWEPVLGADYYEIWRSESADPSSDGASVVGRTATTTWTGKTDGQFFDDGVFYSVVPKAESATLGAAGSFAEWVQPEFAGNYALGILSKNQTTGIGGSLVVTKSASLARADFTSLDSPQSFTIDVCDPTGAHSTTALFAVNDILRATDASGNLLWVKVTAATDKDTYWRYTVTKQSPSAGTNYTIPSGAQILNFGQSGQGTFAVSADGTFGAGTLWTIFTHAGSPWSATTAQVYANDSGQVVAGAGAVTLDVDGITIVQSAAADNLIQWKKTDGTVIGAIGTFISVSGDDSDGSFIVDSGTNNNYAKLKLGARDRNLTDSVYFWLSALGASGTAKANLYGTNFAGLIIGGNGTESPSALLHLKSTAPTTLWEDSTASAKSLSLTVDANTAQFEEYGGAANDLFVLDLANARVGIGTASPADLVNVVGSGSFRVDSSANNGGFSLYYTGASGGSNGPLAFVGVNDGAAMAANDRLGQFAFGGHDGTAVRIGPAMICFASETWSGSARGNFMRFYTTANGATGSSTALTLEQNQQATFAGDLSIAGGKNVILSATTGTKIGTGTTQKLGFWNVTPIAQPSAYTQTYSTADKTHAAHTATSIAAAVPAAAPAGGTGTAAGGWDTAGNRNSAITTINDLRTWAIEMDADYEALFVDVTDLKQLVNSVIDDLQALGLVG